MFPPYAAATNNMHFGRDKCLWCRHLLYEKYTGQ
jgi:hypothetical protein